MCHCCATDILLHSIGFLFHFFHSIDLSAFSVASSLWRWSQVIKIRCLERLVVTLNLLPLLITSSTFWIKWLGIERKLKLQMLKTLRTLLLKCIHNWNKFFYKGFPHRYDIKHYNIDVYLCAALISSHLYSTSFLFDLYPCRTILHNSHDLIHHSLI